MIYFLLTFNRIWSFPLKKNREKIAKYKIIKHFNNHQTNIIQQQLLHSQHHKFPSVKSLLSSYTHKKLKKRGKNGKGVRGRGKKSVKLPEDLASSPSWKNLVL